MATAAPVLIATTPLIAGQRQAALGRARQRLMTGMLLAVAATGVLALRLVDLAVLQERPVASRDPLARYAPKRADIFDRNRVLLARTFDAYAVAVEPRHVVGDKRLLAEQIAAILADVSPAKVYRELTHKGGYRHIARRVLPAEAQRINDLGEPGLRLERTPERLYPHLDLAAHVLGYTNIDGGGRAGIERVLDDQLSGEKTRGKPVFLALDSRVQQALEHELAAAMAKHAALGAGGVVMNVKTGEVIALASLPAYNPNAESKADDNARFNRVTQGVYELGSTFKGFTIAMGIESGVVRSMEQTYDATRPLRIAGFSIHDDHAKNKWLKVPEIFIYSSNIGTSRMAAEIGATRQRAYLEKLGFLEPVSGELVERGRTLYPNTANWGQLATMTVGFGHGMSVTPLHLATGYSTLVNGGIWRPATLLKVEPGKAAPGRRVFSEDTSLKMRALMRMVVLKGTGKRANATGYRVGGKTGTAEKAVGGRYVKSALVVNFAGAFPIDDPKYVVVAMVDQPQSVRGNGRGAGIVAAPVVRNVIERVGPALGVRPDLEKDIDIDSILGLTPEVAGDD